MNQSPKHLIKLLVQRGWKLRRIAGSHHIYKSPNNKEMVSVPVHGNKDISNGLFMNLIKKIGIDKSEL
jgi:predicted RNA binding protein YcfA (HicA-like mRNA interferase family)